MSKQEIQGRTQTEFQSGRPALKCAAEKAVPNTADGWFAKVAHQIPAGDEVPVFNRGVILSFIFSSLRQRDCSMFCVVHPNPFKMVSRDAEMGRSNNVKRIRVRLAVRINT
jgi:hypothetical protein